MGFRIIALSVAAALLAGGASAQQVGAWDADENGLISRDEWREGLRGEGLFAAWDEDENGRIQSEEFGAGLFARFDRDDDGNLTIAEWDAGFDGWYGEEAVDLSQSQWDGDGDGEIAEAEFVEAFERDDLYPTFAIEAKLEDVDGGVDEDGLLDGLFDWFDDDGDEDLGVNEIGWLQ